VAFVGFGADVAEQPHLVSFSLFGRVPGRTLPSSALGRQTTFFFSSPQTSGPLSLFFALVVSPLFKKKSVAFFFFPERVLVLGFPLGHRLSRGRCHPGPFTRRYRCFPFFLLFSPGRHCRCFFFDGQDLVSCGIPRHSRPPSLPPMRAASCFPFGKGVDAGKCPPIFSN